MLNVPIVTWILVLCVACGDSAPGPERPEPVDDLDVPARPRRRTNAEPPIAGATTGDGAPVAISGKPRRFRGRRIDLDVKDAPLADVLRLLADVGNVNIVIGDGVIGQVTLRVRALPWDQVLDTIARSHELDLEWSGGVLLVKPAR
jgi:type IV pilus assembly protein PilQ